MYALRAVFIGLCQNVYAHARVVTGGMRILTGEPLLNNVVNIPYVYRQYYRSDGII